WATAAWITLLTLIFTWYTYAYLPLRDYRPYAEGKSISGQMAESKPPVNKTFISYRNKSTGEVIEYDTSQPYPWDDDNFELVENSTRVVEIEPGIESQVQDFRFTDVDGYDPTQDLLAEPSPVLLIAMYDVLEADTDCMEDVRSLAEAASANGWYVYGVSARDRKSVG